MCILSDHNVSELKNSMINDECVKEEIKGIIKRFLELNENENITQHNHWDTLKALLQGKFIVLKWLH